MCGKTIDGDRIIDSILLLVKNQSIKANERKFIKFSIP